MIWEGDPVTLCQIITTTQFTSSDGGRLHNPQFIFGDAVEFEDIKGTESSPWYYDREGMVYTLSPLECHHSLLYFKTCMEEWLMRWNLTSTQDSLLIGLFTEKRSDFVQSGPWIKVIYR